MDSHIVIDSHSELCEKEEKYTHSDMTWRCMNYDHFVFQINFKPYMLSVRRCIREGRSDLEFIRTSIGHIMEDSHLYIDRITLNDHFESIRKQRIVMKDQISEVCYIYRYIKDGVNKGLCFKHDFKSALDYDLSDYISKYDELRKYMISFLKIPKHDISNDLYIRSNNKLLNQLERLKCETINSLFIPDENTIYCKSTEQIIKSLTNKFKQNESEFKTAI